MAINWSTIPKGYWGIVASHAHDNLEELVSTGDGLSNQHGATSRDKTTPGVESSCEGVDRGSWGGEHFRLRITLDIRSLHCPICEAGVIRVSCKNGESPKFKHQVSQFRAKAQGEAGWARLRYGGHDIRDKRAPVVISIRHGDKHPTLGEGNSGRVPVRIESICPVKGVGDAKGKHKSVSVIQRTVNHCVRGVIELCVNDWDVIKLTLLVIMINFEPVGGDIDQFRNPQEAFTPAVSYRDIRDISRVRHADSKVLPVQRRHRIVSLGVYSNSSLRPDPVQFCLWTSSDLIGMVSPQEHWGKGAGQSWHDLQGDLFVETGNPSTRSSGVPT
jgi:hypothetical protein